METTIYLDVLVLLNIYVSYFLMMGTAKLMSLHLSRIRLLIGCVLGGVYSLVILFDTSSIELVIIKLLMGVSLVMVVFFEKNIIHMLKCGGYFALVNMIYAGFMMALWLFIAPSNMAYKNGVAYFDISALTLVISTIVAYLVITLFCHILNKRNKTTDILSVLVSFNGRETLLSGFVDTGNKLCDIFSSLPVIVCEYNTICDILPDKLQGYFKDPTTFQFEELETSQYQYKLKLIPISVVGSDSALPAFKPDYIIVNGVKKDVVIAVTMSTLSNGEYNAILNPVI